MSLHDCPRLAKAHAQRRLELSLIAAARQRLAGLRLDADRLLAHRELQLVRAGAIGRAQYIQARQRKLVQIKARVKALARVRPEDMAHREMREMGLAA